MGDGPGGAPQRTRRVFLHVGAPKTGTTFLQTLLWDHRHVLRAQHDVLFPGNRYDEHFFAAVDLQDESFHGDPRPDARGAWEHVARQARRWAGTTIISHEVFATATAEQARRAVADLALAEVHIVYTARDLARQLPSHWQEDVKHGATDTFTQWWEAVSRRDDDHHFARWFWPTEDLADVVARWANAVGPQRFHLITVPHARGSGDLWRRFCHVVGLDPAAVDLDDVKITNTGLGVAEIEVVRRVNEHLGGALPPAIYQHVVKGVLAHDTIAGRRAARRVALPAACRPIVDRIARESVTALQGSGVDIVGDVADLLPGPSPGPAGDPDSATDEELAETAIWALHQVLLRLEDERRHHRAQLTRLGFGIPAALAWRARRLLQRSTFGSAWRHRATLRR